MPNKAIQFIKEIYNAYIAHQLPFLAAGVTYFSFLSFFNLLFFLSGLLGFVFVNAEIKKMALDFIIRNIPLFQPLAEENLKAIENFRFSVSIGGIILLAYSSISIFLNINQGLDNIYGVRPQSNLKQIGKGLLVMVLILLSLLIAVCLSYLASFGDSIFQSLSMHVSLSQILSTLISYIFLFVTILLIYRFLVDVQITFSKVVPGTIFSVIVWKILEVIYKFYLDKYFLPSQIQGITGFVIATLLWFYISMLVVFLGAELNLYLAKRKKTRH